MACLMKVYKMEKNINKQTKKQTVSLSAEFVQQELS